MLRKPRAQNLELERLLGERDDLRIKLNLLDERNATDPATIRSMAAQIVDLERQIAASRRKPPR